MDNPRSGVVKLWPEIVLRALESLSLADKKEKVMALDSLDAFAYWPSAISIKPNSSIRLIIKRLAIFSA